MLKTKLSKAGFWSQGFLLIATPYGLSTKAQTASSVKNVEDKFFTSKSGVFKDTAILLSDDAITLGVPVLPDSLSEEAPKISLNPAAVKFVKNYIRRNNEDLVNVKRKSDPYFKII